MTLITIINPDLAYINDIYATRLTISDRCLDILDARHGSGPELMDIYQSASAIYRQNSAELSALHAAARLMGLRDYGDGYEVERSTVAVPLLKREVRDMLQWATADQQLVFKAVLRACGILCVKGEDGITIMPLREA